MENIQTPVNIDFFDKHFSIQYSYKMFLERKSTFINLFFLVCLIVCLGFFYLLFVGFFFFVCLVFFFPFLGAVNFDCELI